jgi:hypothetical protein
VTREEFGLGVLFHFYRGENSILTSIGVMVSILLLDFEANKSFLSVRRIDSGTHNASDDDHVSLI